MSLRDPGRILLVSCYELGHQPLGLAGPLGLLEAEGYAPAAIDLAVERLDEEAIARAAYVGISVPMHTAMRLGVRVARRVRAIHPAAHVCFYGLYAPLQRALLLDEGAALGRPLADTLLGGEYEPALLDDVRAVEARLESSVHATPVVRASPTERTVIARVPVPVPSRRALPALGRYAKLRRADGSEAPAGYTEASRGCLHRCRHCPIPALYDGRFFVVPVETVLADVRAQVQAGAEHVTLGDPDFLNGPRHALAVARAIHAEFPSLSFDVTAKIEHLLRHAELLPELARLGCLFVVSAVESLSDRVLEILDKGHRRADVDRALALCRDAGLVLRPSLLPFTPWSTIDDHLALFEWIDRRSLGEAVDPVQLAIRLLVPPGSLLAAHPEMRPHLSTSGGVLDREALALRWSHPDPRMDALHAESEALVARATVEERPTRAILDELRRLAHATAGRPLPERTAAVWFPTQGAPRLTESWFC